MTSTTGLDIQKELNEENTKLAIDLSQHSMSIELQIRSIALTLAQKHTGDTVVREGNLYQHLKMDNKLIGPLTIDHVIHCALIFERFLWGKWSKGIAEEAIDQTLNEVNEALKEEFQDEAPTRPHSG